MDISNQVIKDYRKQFPNMFLFIPAIKFKGLSKKEVEHMDQLLFFQLFGDFDDYNPGLKFDFDIKKQQIEAFYSTSPMFVRDKMFNLTTNLYESEFKIDQEKHEIVSVYIDGQTYNTTNKTIQFKEIQKKPQSYCFQIFTLQKRPNSLQTTMLHLSEHLLMQACIDAMFENGSYNLQERQIKDFGQLNAVTTGYHMVFKIPPSVIDQLHLKNITQYHFDRELQRSNDELDIRQQITLKDIQSLKICNISELASKNIELLYFILNEYFVGPSFIKTINYNNPIDIHIYNISQINIKKYQDICSNDDSYKILESSQFQEKLI